MKEPQISFFGDLKKREKRIWTGAINSAMNSLSDYERRVVPEFKLYPNLVMSIVDNYDIETLKTDDVAAFLFDMGAWAYARILPPNSVPGKFDRNGLFISFSIKRAFAFLDLTPPEFSIFHEIGHFQIQYHKKISIFRRNINKVELMADKYALYALIRMLYHNPEYKTISKLDIHIKFIASTRKLIRKEIGDDKLSPAALRGKFTRIRNRIMTMLKWEKLCGMENEIECKSAAKRTR